MTLINRIREYQKTLELSVAVDKAIDDCINDGILAEFLVSHRAEVRDMCITEYNEKSFVNGIRAEESERIATKMLKKNKYSYEEIADNCDLTIEQVKDLEAEILQLQ